MTDKEIAEWIRDWMKNHPICQELDSMYDDFRRYRADRFDTGTLTKLIYGMNPLKYMTSVPDGMFFDSYCNEVIIPDNIKSIGSCAFYGSNITSVMIGNGVKSIGEDAFSLCNQLIIVTIGNSVTSIGSSAFYNCDSLMEINFTGTKSQWNSIQLGKSWDSKSALRTIKCTDGIITL